MGIGKKTRLQAKIHRREAKKEKYKLDLIKIIGIIFVVGLAASLVVVKVATIIYPVVYAYIKSFIKHYKTPTVNPHLRTRLNHEDFKLAHFQKEPVLFPSLQRHSNLEHVWTHLEAVCSHEVSSSQECSNDSIIDSVASSVVESSIFNFSSAMREPLSTPHLTTRSNYTKPIANFRSDISLELLIADGDGCATFHQGPQSWSELLIGRKRWFLYRPGGSATSWRHIV